MTKWKDPCEWNPEQNREAYSNEVHAEAVYIVGANGNWRLCEDCKNLPKFKRYRTIKKIQVRTQGNQRMNYAEKLLDPRWQRKRLEIMQRDNWACVGCGDTETTLHVHHIVYHDNPWDARDGELQTLCEACHLGLGEHPHGGLFYIKCRFYSTWHYRHCPMCGSEEQTENSNLCGKCGHFIEPAYKHRDHCPFCGHLAPKYAAELEWDEEGEKHLRAFILCPSCETLFRFGLWPRNAMPIKIERETNRRWNDRIPFV